MVRITDRKPKWVVQAERERSNLQKKKEAAESKTESPTPTPEPPAAMKTPDPPKPVISDADMKVSRRREPVSFFGSLEGVSWCVGPAVLQPLSEVCDQYTDAHYRFIVCPYRFINQVEIGGHFFRGCIG